MATQPLYPLVRSGAFIAPTTSIRNDNETREVLAAAVESLKRIENSFRLTNITLPTSKTSNAIKEFCQLCIGIRSRLPIEPSTIGTKYWEIINQLIHDESPLDPLQKDQFEASLRWCVKNRVLENHEVNLKITYGAESYFAPYLNVIYLSKLFQRRCKEEGRIFSEIVIEKPEACEKGIAFNRSVEIFCKLLRGELINFELIETQVLYNLYIVHKHFCDSFLQDAYEDLRTRFGALKIKQLKHLLNQNNSNDIIQEINKRPDCGISFSESETISISCPLSEETADFLNSPFLSALNFMISRKPCFSIPQDEERPKKIRKLQEGDSSSGQPDSTQLSPLKSVIDLPLFHTASPPPCINLRDCHDLNDEDIEILMQPYRSINIAEVRSGLLILTISATNCIKAGYRKLFSYFETLQDNGLLCTVNISFNGFNPATLDPDAYESLKAFLQQKRKFEITCFELSSLPWVEFLSFCKTNSFDTINFSEDAYHPLTDDHIRVLSRFKFNTLYLPSNCTATSLLTLQVNHLIFDWGDGEVTRDFFYAIIEACSLPQNKNEVHNKILSFNRPSHCPLAECTIRELELEANYVALNSEIIEDPDYPLLELLHRIVEVIEQQPPFQPIAFKILETIIKCAEKNPDWLIQFADLSSKEPLKAIIRLYIFYQKTQKNTFLSFEAIHHLFLPLLNNFLGNYPKLEKHILLIYMRLWSIPEKKKEMNGYLNLLSTSMEMRTDPHYGELLERYFVLLKNIMKPGSTQIFGITTKFSEGDSFERLPSTTRHAFFSCIETIGFQSFCYPLTYSALLLLLERSILLKDNPDIKSWAKMSSPGHFVPFALALWNKKKTAEGIDKQEAWNSATHVMLALAVTLHKDPTTREEAKNLFSNILVQVASSKEQRNIVPDLFQNFELFFPESESKASQDGLRALYSIFRRLVIYKSADTLPAFISSAYNYIFIRLIADDAEVLLHIKAPLALQFAVLAKQRTFQAATFLPIFLALDKRKNNVENLIIDCLDDPTIPPRLVHYFLQNPGRISQNQALVNDIISLEDRRKSDDPNENERKRNDLEKLIEKSLGQGHYPLVYFDPPLSLPLRKKILTFLAKGVENGTLDREKFWSQCVTKPNSLQIRWQIFDLPLSLPTTEEEHQFLFEYLIVLRSYFIFAHSVVLNDPIMSLRDTVFIIDYFFSQDFMKINEFEKIVTHCISNLLTIPDLSTEHQKKLARLCIQLLGCEYSVCLSDCHPRNKYFAKCLITFHDKISTEMVTNILSVYLKCYEGDAPQWAEEGKDFPREFYKLLAICTQDDFKNLDYRESPLQTILLRLPPYFKKLILTYYAQNLSKTLADEEDAVYALAIDMATHSTDHVDSKIITQILISYYQQRGDVVAPKNYVHKIPDENSAILIRLLQHLYSLRQKTKIDRITVISLSKKILGLPAHLINDENLKMVRKLLFDSFNTANDKEKPIFARKIALLFLSILDLPTRNFFVENAPAPIQDLMLDLKMKVINENMRRRVTLLDVDFPALDPAVAASLNFDFLMERMDKLTFDETKSSDLNYYPPSALVGVVADNPYTEAGSTYQFGVLPDDNSVDNIRRAFNRNVFIIRTKGEVRYTAPYDTTKFPRIYQNQVNALDFICFLFNEKPDLNIGFLVAIAELTCSAAMEQGLITIAKNIGHPSLTDIKDPSTATVDELMDLILFHVRKKIFYSVYYRLLKLPEYEKYNDKENDEDKFVHYQRTVLRELDFGLQQEARDDSWPEKVGKTFKNHILTDCLKQYTSTAKIEAILTELRKCEILPKGDFTKKLIDWFKPHCPQEELIDVMSGEIRRDKIIFFLQHCGELEPCVPPFEELDLNESNSEDSDSTATGKEAE